MTMTTTLDFSPNHRLLDEYTRSRTLPTYGDVGPARSSAPVGSSPFLVNGLLAALVGLSIVIFAIGFGSGAAATGSSGPAPIIDARPASVVASTIDVYVVQPGDTLWAIAERITPAGNDLRPTIDYLRSIAGGSQLDVGQRLMIDHTDLLTS